MPVTMSNLLQWHLTEGALFLLIGFTSALKGPAKLAGFLGRPLSLGCTYDKGYKGNIKYWCKGEIMRSCYIVVQTDKTEAEVKVGRTSIKDNQTSFEFTVTLDNLTEEDAGIYWCGIDKRFTDPGFRVTLTVLPAPTTVAVTTTTVPTEQNFPITTTESSVIFGLFDNLTILLPIVFLVLLIILAGALLLIWRLKKKNAAKACKEVPLPMVHDDSESVSYATIRFSTLDEQATYANVQ